MKSEREEESVIMYKCDLNNYNLEKGFMKSLGISIINGIISSNVMNNYAYIYRGAGKGGGGGATGERGPESTKYALVPTVPRNRRLAA